MGARLWCAALAVWIVSNAGWAQTPRPADKLPQIPLSSGALAPSPLPSGLLAQSPLPSGPLAQTGLRSASLPDRTPQAPVPPARGDLFLAGPETYAPRFDRPFVPYPRFLPGAFRFVPVMYWRRSSPRAFAPVRSHGYLRLEENDVITTPAVLAAAAPPAITPPPAVVVRTVPKTFYVIPGCYAGDKPPRPEQLPATCNVADVRTIPADVQPVTGRSPRRHR